MLCPPVLFRLISLLSSLFSRIQSPVQPVQSSSAACSECSVVFSLRFSTFSRLQSSVQHDQLSPASCSALSVVSSLPFIPFSRLQPPVQHVQSSASSFLLTMATEPRGPKLTRPCSISWCRLAVWAELERDWCTLSHRWFCITARDTWRGDEEASVTDSGARDAD